MGKKPEENPVENSMQTSGIETLNVFMQALIETEKPRINTVKSIRSQIEHLNRSCFIWGDGSEIEVPLDSIKSSLGYINTHLNEHPNLLNPVDIIISEMIGALEAESRTSDKSVFVRTKIHTDNKEQNHTELYLNSRSLSDGVMSYSDTYFGLELSSNQAGTHGLIDIYTNYQFSSNNANIRMYFTDPVNFGFDRQLATISILTQAINLAASPKGAKNPEV